MLLSPTPWGKEVFQNNGVTIPIEAVSFGIDPEDYYPLDRTREGNGRLCLFGAAPRFAQGWDIAYKAFWQAFGGRSDVLLLLHFREVAPVGVRFADKNVNVLTGVFPWTISAVFISGLTAWSFRPVGRVGACRLAKPQLPACRLSLPIGVVWPMNCQAGACR